MSDTSLLSYGNASKIKYAERQVIFGGITERFRDINMTAFFPSVRHRSMQML
jgi:hypothetical protein